MLESKRSSPRPESATIVATGIALLLAQLAVRSHGLSFGLKALTQPLYYLPRLLLGSVYDVIYSVTVTFLFWLLLRIAGPRRSLEKAIPKVFAAVAILSIVAAMMDVQFRTIAGTPFTFQWLYYSDFLLSLDAREAITANLSWAWIPYGLLLCIGFLGLSFVVKKTLQWVQSRSPKTRTIVLVAAVCGTIYLPAAGWYVTRPDSPDGTYDNAVFYFLKSCLTAGHRPAIFTMKNSFGNDDFLPVSERPPEPSLAPHDPQIKNVILFVLESVGAEYVEAFGAKYPVTPTLTRYRDRAARFERIYVPVPMTVNALWALECSMYPWISHKLIVREFPKVQAPSLSGELRGLGYQTAFFASQDNRFHRCNLFLPERAFQVIEDCRTLSRGQPIFTGNYDDHSEEGCDDRITAAAFNDWIDAQKGQPFFGMLWTGMTHYPYHLNEKEIDYKTGNGVFNRYLNSLRIGDQALGKVLAHLEERGLADSTLVVVIGDHGESFGEHGGWAHDNIYDQCVRVPLMFINPRLFHGEVYGQIGSSVDVAPTIFDILGQKLPGAWQGRSLFSANRTGRAYFFSPFSGYMFGFREGDYACLFNASREKYEIYNMVSDPYQKKNLASQQPTLASQATERLAGWAQYQNGYIDQLVASPARPIPSVVDVEQAGPLQAGKPQTNEAK